MINYADYKEALPKKLKLWNMDSFNSNLGVTTKLWWQDFFNNKFKGKRILDIGCGKGYHVPYWASNNDVTGIDISKESLDRLREILKRLDLKAELIHRDAERIILEEKFDVININNMLHHAVDVKKVLSNANKMLKENGDLIVVEPVYNFPFRWIIETDFMKGINIFKKYFIGRIEGLEDNEKSLSAKEYISQIKKAGFDIKFRIFDTNFFGYPLTVIRVKNKPIKRIVYEFDRILSSFIPSKFKSFIYIIASKS